MAAILTELSDSLREKGVEQWIVYHGLDKFSLPFDPMEIIKDICLVSFQCANLDPVLTDRPDAFLKDGHWSAYGHSQVGAFLSEKLFVNNGME